VPGARSRPVYVALVGDLFHVNHVKRLRAARSGSWLVVDLLSARWSPRQPSAWDEG
jgi:hypothetical protein